MKPRQERDKSGRITGAVASGLPDGELELRLAADDDDLSDAEVAQLNDVLARGFAAISAGRFRSAADVISDLRGR